jgi:hypothetical protein
MSVLGIEHRALQFKFQKNASLTTKDKNHGDDVFTLYQLRQSDTNLSVPPTCGQACRTQDHEKGKKSKAV